MQRYILFLAVSALVFIPTVFSQNPQDETSRAVGHCTIAE